ncbi:hypothetical protein H4Q26_015018 [Puccinia striiformis f. sp. tritici PST-130]|nr:hypothetical protein H4Q26_015018 [Puccinia striiformis f. sp. tritici PST-130]
MRDKSGPGVRYRAALGPLAVPLLAAGSWIFGVELLLYYSLSDHSLGCHLPHHCRVTAILILSGYPYHRPFNFAHHINRECQKPDQRNFLHGKRSFYFLRSDYVKFPKRTKVFFHRPLRWPHVASA